MKHVKIFASYLNLSSPLIPDLDTPGKICNEIVKDVDEWIKKKRKIISNYTIETNVGVTTSFYIVTISVYYSIRKKKKKKQRK